MFSMTPNSTVLALTTILNFTLISLNKYSHVVFEMTGIFLFKKMQI